MEIRCGNEFKVFIPAKWFTFLQFKLKTVCQIAAPIDSRIVLDNIKKRLGSAPKIYGRAGGRKHEYFLLFGRIREI